MVADGNMSAWTISIHTPIKGVTQSHNGSHQIQTISIHTPIKGVTENTQELEDYIAGFQSTLP